MSPQRPSRSTDWPELNTHLKETQPWTLDETKTSEEEQNHQELQGPKTRKSWVWTYAPPPPHPLRAVTTWPSPAPCWPWQLTAEITPHIVPQQRHGEPCHSANTVVSAKEMCVGGNSPTLPAWSPVNERLEKRQVHHTFVINKEAVWCTPSANPATHPYPHFR